VSSILVGDLNIAPLETDVWSHKQLLKVVSHTPIETENAGDAQGGRLGRPDPDAYSAGREDLHLVELPGRDWDAADRGRRLDHVWSSADLAPALKRIDVLREARGWERAFRPCSGDGAFRFLRPADLPERSGQNALAPRRLSQQSGLKSGPGRH
jgi:hypothetical protein